ncbi:MAG: hypothetical protein KC657_36835 [Myxococcales bacterium]|nr:hypothetical protein [Myxococcales bacterium]
MRPRVHDARLTSPIDVVEAAYEVSASEESWLAGVLRAATRELDAGLGAVAFVLDATPSGPRVVSPVVTRGADPAIAAKVSAAHVEVPPEASERLLSTDVDFGTLVRSFGGLDSPIVRAVQRRMGIRDAYAACARGDGTRLLEITFPSRVALSISARVEAGWRRVLYHLGTALRLRARLAALPAPAALLRPDGALVHAEAPASTRAAREALVAAARQIESARGKARREDPDGALSLWRGLVDGRWSLVDHWEAGGVRFLAAHENPPDRVDARALRPWERAVVTAFVQGATVPEIAFALGFTQASVRQALSRAVRRFGFPNTAALARVGSQGALRRLVVEAGGDRVDVLRVERTAPAGAERGGASMLTPAEREVASLVAVGLSDAEIATRRGVSVRTVSNQVARALSKTGAANRVALARMSIS